MTPSGIERVTFVVAQCLNQLRHRVRAKTVSTENKMQADVRFPVTAKSPTSADQLLGPLKRLSRSVPVDLSVWVKPLGRESYHSPPYIA